MIARRSLIALAVVAVATIGLATHAPPAAAETGSLWTTVYTGPTGAVGQRAQGVAVSRAGALYVAGVANHKEFSTQVVPFLAKFASDGTLVWDRCPSDVVAHGQFTGVSILPNSDILAWGQVGRTGAGLLAARYRPGGARGWATTVMGPVLSGSRVLDAAVDVKGDIYLVGSVGRTQGYDAQIVKLTSGGRVLWRHTLAGQAGQYDELRAVACGPRGTVYAAGVLFRAGAPRWLVVSYSPDGKRRWIHRSSPGGVDDLTIAPGGTLFAAGGGADAGEAFGLLRAYSTAGVLRYGRRLHSTRSGLATTLLYVRLDPSGDVVCAGDTNESASFGSYLSDYLVARYDSRGTCQFSDTWAGDSGLEDWVYGLECAADGSIYVCGESNSGNGYSRLVVVPYNASGARGEPMIDQAPPYDEDSCASALSPLGPVVVGSRTIELDGRIHALVAQFPLLPPTEP